MRHAENPWPNPFGHPGPRDEVPDTGPHLDEIASVDPERARIRGRDPEWIVVRDFVQPLDRRSGVNQCRQPEIRQKIELTVRRFQVAPVHMTWNVLRDGVLGPAPRRKRWRIELEAARRRIE